MKLVRAHEGLESAFATVADDMFRLFLSKSENEPLLLGLCGGRSVVGLVKALRDAAKSLPPTLMRRIQFFIVDERLVPLTDEQSNYGGLKRQLFDELVREDIIDEAQLHPFIPDPGQPDHGCAAYAAEFEKCGGRFTCVVLGAGEDGHVAGLFPGNSVLQRYEPTFFSFFDSPKPPRQRMTASRSLLASAELAVLLIVGEAKRTAWSNYNDSASTIESCPALLAREARDLIVVTDLQ